MCLKVFKVTPDLMCVRQRHGVSCTKMLVIEALCSQGKSVLLFACGPLLKFDARLTLLITLTGRHFENECSERIYAKSETSMGGTKVCGSPYA